MRRLLASDLAADLPLHGTAASRAIEGDAQAGLPPHTLMRRAGTAVARLALAVAPHARHVWIAAGPGNNGGDGFEAAIHLLRAGKRVTVTFAGDAARLPPDARDAFERAREAGVAVVAATGTVADAPAGAARDGDPPPPAASPAPSDLGPGDLAIDALLGLGVSRPPRGAVAALIDALNALPCPVLAVDLPSGLDAGTGQPARGGDDAQEERAARHAGGGGPDTPDVPGGNGTVEPAGEAGQAPRSAPTDAPTAPSRCVRARHTLALLTAKPGLHTGSGRELAGEVWLDDLGVAPSRAPDAWLTGTASVAGVRPGRGHAAHKGSYGDVAVVGGAAGMSGGALLAARAAHAAGAGRVWLNLLDPLPVALDVARPELMWRDDWWREIDDAALERTVVVCGCGGGEAVAAALPRLLDGTRRLVLDADALNAVARDAGLRERLAARAGRGAATVLTPHPLEAARLLGSDAERVQADRLAAARGIAERDGCIVVLKGSGTVIAAPGRVPHSTRPATRRSPPPAPGTCWPAGWEACGHSRPARSRRRIRASTRRSRQCMSTARRRTGRRWRRCGQGSWSRSC